MRRGLFFFAFSLKKKTLKFVLFVLGQPKWKFSTGEKAFDARKNDFAPSEKFSCYTPGLVMGLCYKEG